LNYNKDKLKSIKHQKDAKESSLRMEYQTTENYVKNLKIYIKDSVWCDHRYGERMENKMEWLTIVSAGE
jgi:predicted Ser/Thr protein kinase